jgi:uncharacterized repeat protein (TIGR01451 family)
MMNLKTIKFLPVLIGLFGLGLFVLPSLNPIFSCVPSAGTIILEKVTNPAGDPTFFNFTTTNLPNSNFQHRSGTLLVWQNIPVGVHTITENPLNGWLLTGASCTSTGGNSHITSIANGVSVNLAADETVTCTFTNTKLGSISGYKFQSVENNDAVEDHQQIGLSDWTIYVDSNDNGILDSGETFTTTDSDGHYEFTNLVADTYVVREVGQPGWTQISPSEGKYVINLSAGQDYTGANFINRKLSNGLTITKTNDKEDSFINPGMDVNYTIVVTNSGEDTLYNVEVADMLPAGFNYKAGSAKVDGVANEPTIAGNTLVWHIGNLPENQSATLVYITTADADVPKGIYTNSAQAEGFNRFEKTISTEEVKSSVEVKIPSVLGETTEITPAVLPNTGGELPIFPLTLTFLGSTLAIIERSARKFLSK